MSSGVQELRTIVQEGIRVQAGGADPVDYIDAANAVRDAVTRQNHVIFGRRGCGKTLLLHEATKRMPNSVRVLEQGEWNDQNESKRDIKMVCHHCYDKLRSHATNS